MNISQFNYRYFKGLTVITLLVVAWIGSVQAAPSAELWSMWKASDDKNLAKIDHSPWQQILDKYLDTNHPSGVNRFDYQGLVKATGDRTAFFGYIDQLEGIDPRGYSSLEQQAYWINLYNALTVKLIVEKYPVDSITDIHESFFGFGPWDDKYSKVAGENLTLNDIEHRILRPIWQDPRVHYVVNCASIGCPNLLPTAFTGDNVEELYNEAAKQYVNHVRGVTVNDNGAVLSKIYEWYIVDFGNNERALLEHLQQYAEPKLKQKLAGFNGNIEYAYDWDLNEP